jgi:hypothetical protein
MSLSSGHARVLLRLQRNSFGYFVHEINRANGLVLDKTSENWPASIAAMGMALAAYPVGVRRKFVSREVAAQLTLAMLRFLAASEQGPAADATGHKGFYYHFLDMETGRRAWQSELSSVDTALLIAGVLAATEFFDGEGHAEAELRGLGRMLYEREQVEDERVDWAWMLAGRDTLCHGWRPEHGFLPYHWEGYDEALILYLLALGSPTHPIDPVSYDAWCASYEWKTIYGFDYVYAGPLFTHQLSHIWCDFRGIRDRFMRDHDSSATRRGARRSAPTTARSRRGRWRHRFPSPPRSSSRPWQTSSSSQSTRRIHTGSKRRSIRLIRCTAMTGSAGSHPTTSASTRGRRC